MTGKPEIAPPPKSWNAGLGVAQQGNFVACKWVVTRKIAGGDDAQGDIYLAPVHGLPRDALPLPTGWDQMCMLAGWC